MIYLSSITEIIWSNFGQYIQKKVILFQISNKQANFAYSMFKCSQKRGLEAYKTFCAL